MANRDPSVFPDPNVLDMGRQGNRHTSFGLGIHRCIGSNTARMVFKRMLVAVLDRMPDFTCDPAGAVHYDTIGVIQGMKHLPATFTPGPRLGPGLAETIAAMQAVVDEQRLAEPVTVRKGHGEDLATKSGARGLRGRGRRRAFSAPPRYLPPLAAVAPARSFSR